MTMPQFIIDVDLSLTLEELSALKKLADIQATDVAACAKQCMMNGCEEALQKYQDAIIVEPEQLELPLMSESNAE